MLGGPASRVVPGRRVVQKRRRGFPRAGGRDRRPRGDLRGLARLLRRSPPEQARATGKWRDNIWRGGSRAVRANNRQPAGVHRPLLGTTRATRSGGPGVIGADVLLPMAAMAAGQGTEPPGAAGFLHRFPDPISPYVCRNASRYAVRSVRHVSIARSEYLRWPPRDVRRGVLHTL